MDRFLKAARELLADSDIGDVTVQRVAERSGQSLRSFYQYFSGKHELLLALLEEDVAWTARHIALVVATVDDPLVRLELFVFECHRLSLPAAPAWRPIEGEPHPTALAEFAQQLLTRHAREAGQAFGPLVDLLEGLLGDAGSANLLRPGLDHRRVAGVLLQAVLFDAFAVTISGSHLGHESNGALWAMLSHGIVA